MDNDSFTPLSDLLEAAAPAGYEIPAQQVWIESIREAADEIDVDAYGNAVATYDGGADSPVIALVAHIDQIGFIVREIDDDGFLRVGSIGDIDPTVSRGQQVHIHTSGGHIDGVIGQSSLYLRGDTEGTTIPEQHVDAGFSSKEAAESVVKVGDPVTYVPRPNQLDGTRITSWGLDNRTGAMAIGEAFRRIVKQQPDVTVYAISTVQEETGLHGAAMVGYEYEPDAALVVDVTHATDHPATPANSGGNIRLGDGPVIMRGSTNHQRLVEHALNASDEAGIPIQIQAAGAPFGTDALTIFTQRGGIPTLDIALPLRYLHTPAETIDSTDLEQLIHLLETFILDASDHGTYTVFSEEFD